MTSWSWLIFSCVLALVCYGGLGVFLGSVMGHHYMVGLVAGLFSVMIGMLSLRKIDRPL